VPDAALGCGWAWLWFWLFLFVIAFAGWGWGGWYGGWGGPWAWWGPRQAPPPQAASPQTANPPQASVAPGEFLGKAVTVSGQVEQVFGPQAFTLAGSGGGRHLLVVSKSTKAPTVAKGETVQVSGTVERYDADELHKTTGADLSKVPSADFEGRPAVLASSVTAKSSSG
jgi:hypothetical protein